MPSATQKRDREWATKALEKAGYGKDVAVYRVYAPYNAVEPIEVLFITTTGRPRTALMDPEGKVLRLTDW